MAVFIRMNFILSDTTIIALMMLLGIAIRFVYVLNSVEQIENAEIVRTKLWNDKRELHGPFDIIGDIHGCCDELEMLLDQLGYVRTDGVYRHPGGRQAAFLGDFCDRGNRNADVLRLVMDMVKSGSAIAVPGNHDVKLLKYLRGKKAGGRFLYRRADQPLCAG